MTELPVVIGTRAAARASTKVAVAFYTLGILGAEACVAFVSIVPGLVAHALLALAILNHYLLARHDAEGAIVRCLRCHTTFDMPVDGEAAKTRFGCPNCGFLDSTVLEPNPSGVARSVSPRQLDVLLVLPLIPLLRILSLTMAVEEVPEIYRYAIVGAPLLLTSVLLSRLTGLVSIVRSLSWRAVGLQGLVALTGIPLSLLAFLIVRPDPLVDGWNWGPLLAGSAILFVFTGVTEELIFRGLLQNALVGILGRAALVWGSLLFVAAYLGALPAGYVVFVAAFGLAFAWLVDRTRSLLGVAIAHGLLNIGMLLVWPLALG